MTRGNMITITRRIGLAAAALVAVLPTVQAMASTNTARFAWFDYRGSDPADTVPLKPGQYRNPILQGFYSDPSVTRVGRDYYLVTSTFAWFPGIPVFRSRDLVHWTQIGNAIDRPGQLDFAHLRLSRGVFAPSITYHDGRFWIINTCVDCGDNFVVTATNPAGPWSDPVWLKGIDGIDTSLFFDDDGSAWIVNNGPPPETPRYDGHRAIWIQQFDPVARTMVGPRKVLLDGGVDPSANPVWIEGPHIFKRDGRYYLICAEGGTSVNHSEVVLRADHVTGPYTPYPGNPILTQRDLPADRPLPITSAGHASFVETPKGDWWATFLATRPYADDLYNTGRETFLLPVAWKDGWPMILPRGLPIPQTHARPDLPPEPAPATPTSGPFHIRVAFTGPALPPDWMMMRQPATRWWHLGHGLSLDARTESLGDEANPSFVARRQQHGDFRAETAMTFSPHEGDIAGIVALQNDDYFYTLGLTNMGGLTFVQLYERAGKQDPAAGRVIASAPVSLAAGAPLYLAISAKGGAYSFDYAVKPGAWRRLKADADGTILSTHVAGGFVGAMIGLYAHSAPTQAPPAG